MSAAVKTWPMSGKMTGAMARKISGGGGGGVSCSYALDNTTFAYVPGTVAWPSFSNETQTVSLTLGGDDIKALVTSAETSSGHKP